VVGGANEVGRVGLRANRARDGRRDDGDSCPAHHDRDEDFDQS
jgi:hypothetical protein